MTDLRTCDVKELRRYAAEEVMGWQDWLHSDGPRSYEFWSDGKREIMRQDAWHPDTDYDQLRMVEEKVGVFPMVVYRPKFKDVWCEDNCSLTEGCHDKSELLARLRLACIVHQEMNK